MAEGDELRRIEAIVSGQPLGVSPFARRLRLGLMVTGALTVLTIAEYLIAVNLKHPLLPLIPFALVKGLLILEYFMHVSALFGKGEH